MTTFPTLNHPRYAEAVANLERLTADHRQAGADLDRLRGTRRAGTDDQGRPRYLDGDLTAAIADDDTDRARAALEGRKDPGDRRERAVRAEITATVDRQRVLAQSLEQAEAAVYAALYEDAQEIAAVAAETVTDAETEYRLALERVQEAREAFWQSKRLATWAANPRSRWKDVPAPFVTALRSLSLNGGPVDPAPIWAALLAEVTPPAVVRKVVRYDTQPYRVIRGGALVEQGIRATPVYEDEQPAVPDVQVGVVFDGALVYTGSGDPE